MQSAAAIGSLLIEGIGDTIRVSMTGDPVAEIGVGYEILKAVGLVSHGIRIISCPTCGRTDPTINLYEIAETLEVKLKEKFAAVLQEKKRIISVAVMGCEVNGPGEASDADIGIAGARSGNFILFARGKKIGKVSSEKLYLEVISRVELMI